MIRRTFQIIRGVGPWRERDLWARGFLTWDDVPDDASQVAISEQQDEALRHKIDALAAAIGARDLKTLALALPPREQWRLYPLFADDAAFFDIETDGRERLRPTVVTVMDREGVHLFVDGRNMDALASRLALSPIWVTFNGSVFDVPVLRRHIESLADPLVHLDLRMLTRRARLRGGLKDIEEQLQLGRPLRLRGLHGLQAVELWRAYQETGQIELLRLLAEYNAYDAIHLRSVLEHSYNRIVERWALGEPPLRVFERGDVLYDLTKLLTALEPTQADLAAQHRHAPHDRQLDEL